MNRKGGKSSREAKAPEREAPRTARSAGRGWRPVWSVGLLAAATLLVFAPTLGHPFSSWDDTINVVENPHLNPVSWGSVAQFWREPYAFLYVPVTYTFWSAEAWLGESRATPDAPRHLAPGVFHAGNVALHLANVLLVWNVLRLLVRAEPAALCGALIYAVHPLQVETVAWVTESKGLLAGALGWFAVWQHLLAERSTATEASPPEESASLAHPSTRASIARHIIASVAFTLALLAKPSAVALAPIALVLDVAFLRTSIKRSLVTLSPWFALACGSMVVTWWQQSGESLHFAAPPFWQRPFIAGDALAFYLLKTVAPFNLGIDYGRSPTAIFADGTAYAMWLVPVVVAVVIYGTRERRAWWGALAVFVAGLLPVLGLVPFSFQDFSTVADRYAYLAMLGPALAVAWFLAARQQTAWLVACAGLIAFYSVASAWQVSRWRDDRTLFAHAIEVNPQSFLAHNLLGLALVEQQPPDAAGAIEHFQAAIEIAPQRARSYCNLGLLYQRAKRYELALREYRRAAEVDPQLAEPLFGSALALTSLGRHDEAIPVYRQALELEPAYAAGWFNLALSLGATGDDEGATDSLRRALEWAPTLEPAHVELVRLLILNRRTPEVRAEFERRIALSPDDAKLHDRYALALYHLGEHDEALAEVDRAIELAPRDLTPRLHRASILLRRGDVQGAIDQLLWIEERQPGSPAALDLAWIRAVHPDARWRNGEQAVELAGGYNENVRFADPRGLDVLAAAYAEAGDYAQAVETARQAQELARTREHEELGKAIARRLTEYEAGRPYRANPEEL